MNAIIANYLKQRILDNITWADRVVGLVRPLSFMQETSMPGAIRKTIPISCDIEVSQRDCISNKQHPVVPDSKLKALIYFEDFGASAAGKDARGLTYTASLKLVCWMNLQKLGQTGCSASAYAMTQIIETIDKSPVVNVAPINSIKVTEIGIDTKSNAIFSKYTYDETQVQYLHYPYDYFALSLKIDFSIPFGCVNDSWVNTEIECLTN